MARKLYENPDYELAVSAAALYRNWSSNLALNVPGDTINVDLPSVVSAYLALDKAWGSAGDADWRWTTTVGLIYDHYTSSSQTFQSGAPFAVPPGFPVSSTGVIASEDFFKPFIGVKATNGEWSVLGEYKPRLQWGNFNYATEVWSLAVRKELTVNWAATAGVTNFNLPYTDSDPGFFLDVSYKFGK